MSAEEIAKKRLAGLKKDTLNAMKPAGMRFKAAAKLDTSQVEDRRSQFFDLRPYKRTKINPYGRRTEKPRYQ